MRGWVLAGLIGLGSLGTGVAWVWRELNRQLTPAPSPPLPPLLAGATASGGQFFGCERPDMIRTNPQSLEIAHRLTALAPRGSQASALEQALLKQGFALKGPCETDPHIRRALFRQARGGGLTYAGWAEVWWAVDEQERIEWTSGNIAYSGL